MSVPYQPEEPFEPQRELTYFDYFGAIGSDLVRLAGVVRREWRVFWTAFALCMVIALFNALFAPPVYRAETVLTPRQQQSMGGLGGLFSGSLGSVASMVGLGGDANTKELVTELRSRKIIYSVINRYDLKKAFFSSLWDNETKSWKLVQPGFSSRVLHFLNGTPLPPPRRGPSIEDAYNVFLKKMAAVEEPQSQIIRVTFDGSDPELASRWTNAIVSMLNDGRRQQAISRSQNRIEFLQSRLQTTSSVETRQVLVNLIQAEAENIVIAQSEPQFVLRVVDPAVPPDYPVWPKRSLILFLGALIGVVVGSLVALLWASIAETQLGYWICVLLQRITSIGARRTTVVES